MEEGDSNCVTFQLEIRNSFFLTTDHFGPTFYVNCLNESSWRIRFSKFDESYFTFQLICLDSKDKKPIILDIEWSLMNKNGAVAWRDQKKNIDFLPDSINSVTLKLQKKDPALFRFERDVETLKCRLWNCKKRLTSPVCFSAWSYLVTRQTTFDWRIANFKKLKCNSSKRTYEIRNGANLPSFSVDVFLNGPTSNQAEVCLDVKQHCKSICDVKTSWKISVMDTLGQSAKNIEFSTRLSPSIAFHTQLLTKDELSTMREQILIDNGLNLEFDVTFSTGEVLNKIECVSYNMYQGDFHLRPLTDSKDVANNDMSASLQADLLFMYRENTLSDFELSTEGQTFKVHKNILSARSPVFRVMFTGEMAEATGTSLDVPDIDKETLDSLLMFIYTGTTDPLTFETAMNLYYAADKYEILTLKKLCSEFLGLHVSRDNLCDVLLIADRHQDNELLAALNNFMLCNDKEIIESKEWEEFLDKHPLLAAKTMRSILQKTRYSADKS